MSRETPRFCISGLHMAALFFRGVAGDGRGGGVGILVADRIFTGIWSIKGTHGTGQPEGIDRMKLFSTPLNRSFSCRSFSCRQCSHWDTTPRSRLKSSQHSRQQNWKTWS
ncbi:hypothetical protein A6R68_22289 [Neotoma lepida]|uniref:Uncharacterized protein n=1 Tax=Neotoma lepida TaxID=56216 RepID=A0A1A6HZM6_NEOLE|nr:hypothetical protein A6R68_22289 [Neotoma lepida]